MHTNLIGVAGPTGDLGHRIIAALVKRNARVRAFIRPGTPAKEIDGLMEMGVECFEANPASVDEMTTACAGVSCVVSALNGLHAVIIERQGVLLEAAVAAGVPRFIPSAFSEDFTRTKDGHNRNLDLRRQFEQQLDEAHVRATSILNGAFMDMIGEEMPTLQPGIHKVLYWNDADQALDFTTKNDVAAYTAAAALDEHSPRYLRIAGESVTSRQLASIASEVTGEKYRPLWVGNTTTLDFTIKLAKWFTPDSEDPFPAWQGMQYMRDMFTGDGKLRELDNDRYPSVRWTSIREYLTGKLMK